MATLTMRQIGSYCYKAGFTTKAKLSTAIAVAWAESSGRTDVVNRLGCTGLFQIYVKVHIRNHPTWTTAAMKQPYNNAKAAYTLSSGGTNWRPWEAYTKGMHKKYMGPATKAAREVIATKGAGGTKATPPPPGPSLAKTLATAASQIGYVERGNNRTKYWTELAPRLQGQPWCGAFTHWVLKKNGIDITKLGCSNPYYTPTIVSWAKKTKRWTQTPKPGYLVLFSWNGKGAQHVEIVEKVTSQRNVQTIGGNTSSGARGSQNNGGGVWRRRRTAGIMGYVRIDYDPSAGAGDRTPAPGTTPAPQPAPQPTPQPTVQKKVPETGRWDNNTAVALAEIIGMGPITSNKMYWRRVEEWVGLEGKWVDGELDSVTIQALQWRTNQAIIDGVWNSRTIQNIQRYINENDV